MPSPSYSNANGYIGEQFITIAFDAELDAGNPPSSFDFDLQINGTGVGVTSVTVNSSARTVSLGFTGAPLTAGDIVDFAYYDPTSGNDANAIQGLDGADANDLFHSLIVSIGRPASGPVVTDANITISGGTGAGGAYKIGDTVTATWNNTPGGDNNSGVTSVTADLSEFGGGAAVAATNSAGVWTASYTITSGAIDANNRNVAFTATDSNGSTTTADTTNTTVDNIAPTVTDARISISGGTGSGGAYKFGDTVTATWNNTVGGDNNADTISSATVDFSQFGGGSSVAATNSAGTWTATYVLAGPISAANRNVAFRVSDNAGNITTRADTSNATVDTIAPAAPSAPDLTSGTDTGTSSTDNITRNAVPTFTGTAENGATVTLYDTDGVTALGSTTATGGNWAITSSTLSSGAHTITARATDLAGNVSSSSGGLAVLVDQVPPTVTITSSTSTLKTGETATITFSFSEDPGATFTWDGSAGDVVVSGGTLSAISGSGLTRTAVFAPSADTDNGIASITVAAGSYIDTAGNLGGAGATPSLTFDTRPPAAPSTPDLIASSDTGNSTIDNITSNTTPTFEGTAESGAIVTLYDTDGATVLGSAVAFGGTYSIISSTLTAGSHTVKARATDAAGNVGPISSGITVDILTGAPTAAITIADTSLTAGETTTVTVTFSREVSGFTVSDLTAANGTISNLTQSSGDRRVYTATLTPTVNVSATTNAVTLDNSGVQDLAGNAGSGATNSNNYAIDTVVVAPPADPPGPVITNNDQGGHTIATDDASLINLSQGTSGIDQVVYGGSGTVTLPSNIENVLLTGTANSDVTANEVANLIVGNTGDNTVIAGEERDTVMGGGGQDAIFGNQGDDQLYGNQGNDTLFGGQGQDTTFGGRDADMQFGNLGSDVLFGNLGADSLWGGQDNDTLFGGQGNDILSGDLGDDVLSGDLGADTYVFRQNSGRDLILGFNQEDGDRIDLQGQSYTLSTAANGNALLTLSGGGSVEMAGIRQAQIGAGFFA